VNRIDVPADCYLLHAVKHDAYLTQVPPKCLGEQPTSLEKAGDGFILIHDHTAVFPDLAPLHRQTHFLLEFKKVIGNMMFNDGYSYTDYLHLRFPLISPKMFTW
jgi:hypothetical protein